MHVRRAACYVRAGHSGAEVGDERHLACLVCEVSIRLVPRAFYTAVMPQYDPPEIEQAPLEKLYLHVKQLSHRTSPLDVATFGRPGTERIFDWCIPRGDCGSSTCRWSVMGCRRVVRRSSGNAGVAQECEASVGVSHTTTLRHCTSMQSPAFGGASVHALPPASSRFHSSAALGETRLRPRTPGSSAKFRARSVQLLWNSGLASFVRHGAENFRRAWDVGQHPSRPNIGGAPPRTRPSCMKLHRPRPQSGWAPLASARSRAWVAAAQNHTNHRLGRGRPKLGRRHPHPSPAKTGRTP